MQLSHASKTELSQIFFFDRSLLSVKKGIFIEFWRNHICICKDTINCTLYPRSIQRMINQKVFELPSGKFKKIFSQLVLTIKNNLCFWNCHFLPKSFAIWFLSSVFCLPHPSSFKQAKPSLTAYNSRGSARNF